MDLELVEYVKKRPVVTKADIKKMLNTGDSYAYLRLQRLEKKGVLTQIMKGKYTAQSDPLLVATNLFHPCYVSFLAASSFYGYTEQVPHTITVMNSRNKEIVFEGKTILLLNKKDNVFGYRKMTAPAGDVFMAEPEKLLLDCLRYQQHAGNFSETVKIAKNADLDRGKIVRHLKRIGNLSLAKRAGFLLERFRGADIIEEFEMDNNYAELEHGNKGTRTSTKWRIRYDL